MSLNKDAIVGICLIMICGGLMLASFDIREPDYGVLSPAVWPRLIILIMGVLSLIFFLQSVSGKSRIPQTQSASSSQAQSADAAARPQGFIEFLKYWRNVFTVFIAFGIYLFVLPQLGMLISNILLSFSLLSLLGGWRQIVLHLCIAVGTSGGMWLLFSFVLEVFLPRGNLTGF